MLFRPPACRPAVRRSIRAIPEGIWIADDVLSATLQRFCLVASSSKRNESSVPGPMESRRRIGKRRMAILSEAIQMPTQNLGAPWGMSESLYRQQWQWEAPSKRQPLPTSGDKPQLPAWLSEYQSVPIDGLPETFTPEACISVNREESSTNVQDNLRIFRELLKASSTDRVQYLCDSFNNVFRQNLVLGLVSEDLLCRSLQCITEDIREVTGDEVLAASCCLSFYMATWDGIKACRVLRPVDFKSDILDRLLVLLGQLHSTLAVQDLAIDVVQATSQSQVAQMKDGILSVVRGWLSSWTNLEFDGRTHMEATMLHDLHDAMHIMQPLKESVTMLAKFLGQLPSIMAPNILNASTDYLVSMVFANFKGPLRTLRTLRYSWVSVVANMPRVDEDLLIDIWSRMDFSRVSSENSGGYIPSIPHLSMHESCNLLLDFWINNRQIKAAESVRAMFVASVQKSGKSDSARYLLQAVERFHEDWSKKAECFFRFLRRLGKPRSVYHTFRNLLAQNLHLPASVVAKEIHEMSSVDPRCALNLYKLNHKVQHYRTRLRLDWCPGLIIAMIRSPDFDSAEIWGSLRVPLFIPRQKRLFCKPLHPARIDLVQEMALEFARADCRSPRLALRNVMRCVLYLRGHGVPVSADLSTALTHVGIARSFVSDHLVGRQKARWILDIVKKAEGDEATAKTYEAMQPWLKAQRAKQRRLQREASLGTGSPIH